MPPRLPKLVLSAVFASLGACAEAPPGGHVGKLVLALDADLDAGDYTLAYARVSLEGPETRTFELSEAAREQSLPEGVYTVSVADDFRVVERAAPDAALPAVLVGENPTSVLVAAGETTELTLRFELAAPAKPELGTGTVTIDVDVSDTEGPLPCARYLELSELDYDQVGSDTQEFVEVSLSHVCTASLEGVVVELVNGGDGSVYARYDLADASATLTADQVLVLGDADVLSTLPQGTPRITLNGSGLQNGPDGVRIVRADEVFDSMSYEGAVAGAGRGMPAAIDDGASSLTRCTRSGDDAQDFVLQAPSPGRLAPCTPAP